MEKIVKCVGAAKQPEGILENMAGHDPTGGSTAYEQSESLLTKVDNMAVNDLADGPTDSTCEQSEIILPKVETMAGYDLAGRSTVIEYEQS